MKDNWRTPALLWWLALTAWLSSSVIWLRW
jgi:hypothetical protein